MVMFHFPLILITAHSADLRFRELYMNQNESFFQLVWRHVSYFSLIVMQAMNAYFFWLAYGTMALVLGPLRTWAAFLGVWMWYSTIYLGHDDMSIVAQIWCSDPSSAVESDFEGEGSSCMG
ncbi:UNVERIFIED_CONTAM: hypothetical protein GTU68_024497, partial [Idotea baltica]|nr:hypothetical protein [Idotea baltica]